MNLLETKMKYEILKDEFIEFDGRKLYRIRALKDFHNVKKGKVGGYIASERNLSHEGEAWVYGNACVSGDARISDDAWVYGNARVSGNVRVSDDARVYGDARVSGNACVSGDARISDDAWVYGNACVYGNAQVAGNAQVLNRHSVVWFSNVGTENGTLTVYCGKNGLIATRGCLTGSVEEFLDKSAKVHDEKTKREYELLIEVARSRLGEAQGNIEDE
nr:MAG TPA: Putative transferase, nesg, ydcK, Structural Genomics.38A [Caudoviricetes sp.]